MFHSIILPSQCEQQGTEEIALGLWPSSSNRNRSCYLPQILQTEPRMSRVFPSLLQPCYFISQIPCQWAHHASLSSAVPPHTYYCFTERPPQSVSVWGEPLYQQCFKQPLCGCMAAQETDLGGLSSGFGMICQVSWGKTLFPLCHLHKVS